MSKQISADELLSLVKANREGSLSDEELLHIMLQNAPEAQSCREHTENISKDLQDKAYDSATYTDKLFDELTERQIHNIDAYYDCIRLYEDGNYEDLHFTIENMECELDRTIDKTAEILQKCLNSIRRSPQISLVKCKQAIAQYPTFNSFVKDGLAGFAKENNLTKMQQLYVALINCFAFSIRSDTYC